MYVNVGKKLWSQYLHKYYTSDRPRSYHTYVHYLQKCLIGLYIIYYCHQNIRIYSL